MFWGLVLDGNKRYTQIVNHPFHISMAVLGKGEDKDVSVMMYHEKAAFLLCRLNQTNPQQPLDLNFTEGEDVSLYLVGGSGPVHLTGYLGEIEPDYGFHGNSDEVFHPDDLDDETSSSEEEELDDEGPTFRQLALMGNDLEDSDSSEEWTPSAKAKLTMAAAGSGSQRRKRSAVDESAKVQSENGRKRRKVTLEMADDDQESSDSDDETYEEVDESSEDQSESDSMVVHGYDNEEQLSDEDSDSEEVSDEDSDSEEASDEDSSSDIQQDSSSPEKMTSPPASIKKKNQKKSAKDKNVQQNNAAITSNKKKRRRRNRKKKSKGQAE